MSNVFENLLYWDDKTLDVIARSGAELRRLAGRHRLHVQAAPGRQVPRRDRDGRRTRSQFSYSRVLDPDDEFYKLGQPFPLMDFWYGAIDPKQTIVQDKYTVTLKLKQPFSPLEGYLAWPAASIVSPTARQEIRRRLPRESGRHRAVQVRLLGPQSEGHVQPLRRLLGRQSQPG